MRKLLVCTLAVFMLFCLSACSGTPKVDELPANAVLVFQQDFDKQTGANVAHGNWNAQGTGYFIVAVNFTKGNFKTMEVYDGNANNAVLLALQKPDSRGMYQSESGDMSNGHFGMRFKNLNNATGTISVYYVADE